MASYLGFHCNESVPVPHQLPTSLAQTHFWDKGILDGVPSVLNAYTSGTDDLEISQFSELHENLDDSDVIPSSQLPPSYHQWRSVHTPELCAPDPDLGLTPEKRMPFARGSVKADVKDKTERKVRFDVASSSESELEKSPDASMKGKSDASDETSCECLVESVGPSVQNSKQHEEMPKVYTYSLKSYPESALKDTQITDLETAVSTDGKKKRSKLNDMLLKFSKDDKSLVPDELCNDSLVRREQEEIPVVTEYNYPFKDVKEQESVVLFSSAFERPEYNSTLRLGNEMKDLASQRRDVAKAVRKTLEESDSLRTGINEKVTIGCPSIHVFAQDQHCLFVINYLLFIVM